MLKLTEAAAYLRLHPNSVRRLCKAGKLAYLFVGGEYRFEAEALRFGAAADAAAHEEGKL